MSKIQKLSFKKIDPKILAELCDLVEQNNKRLAENNFLSVSTGGFELRLTRTK